MLPAFDVTGAVAVLNQTLEYAYPTMTIVGELSDFRVSKGKWLYFDIKDAKSKLKCFGTVYQLKTALEEGMQVEVVAQPRLHNLYGFSLNVMQIKPVGEGSLKKAKDLLLARLEKEGLFTPERKRFLPYPPEKIALVTSGQSAAYADFVKIISARWPLLEIELYDVQVQGVQAEDDIVAAFKRINEQATSAEVIILIRGGGSIDDLSVFSTEPVTRAVASSRIPTMVAIGHEVDLSLAELAADVRASTPSNAAELLVPDVQDVAERLRAKEKYLDTVVRDEIARRRDELRAKSLLLQQATELFMNDAHQFLVHATLRLESYHPKQVLKRGYGLVRIGGKLVGAHTEIQNGDNVEIELEQAVIQSRVTAVNKKTEENHGSTKNV